MASVDSESKDNVSKTFSKSKWNESVAAMKDLLAQINQYEQNSNTQTTNDDDAVVQRLTDGISKLNENLFNTNQQQQDIEKKLGNLDDKEFDALLNEVNEQKNQGKYENKTAK